MTPPVRGRQREPRATARSRAQPKAHTHTYFTARCTLTVHLVCSPFSLTLLLPITLRVAPYRSRRPKVRAPPPVSRKYMYERAGGVPVYVVSGTHSQ